MKALTWQGKRAFESRRFPTRRSGSRPTWSSGWPRLVCATQICISTRFLGTRRSAARSRPI